MAKFDLRPESFVFSTVIPTRWRDHDALGHVNHAEYVTFLETARCAWLEAHGIHVRGGPEGPVIAQVEIRYRRVVTYPEALRIYLRPMAVRESSFKLEYAVYVEGTNELAADAETLIIWLTYESGKRTPMDRGWMRVVRGERMP